MGLLCDIKRQTRAVHLSDLVQNRSLMELRSEGWGTGKGRTNKQNKQIHLTITLSHAVYAVHKDNTIYFIFWFSCLSEF